MASRRSSIANAFFWAASMAIGVGIVDGLIEDRSSAEVVHNASLAASAAGIVGYAEKRRSPS